MPTPWPTTEANTENTADTIRANAENTADKVDNAVDNGTMTATGNTTTNSSK